MLKNLRLLVAVALVLISGQALAVTNFPTILDTDGVLGVAIPGTPVASSHHNNTRDAIIALETKVGVNGSAIVTTLDYLLKNPLSIDPGHEHSSASLPPTTAFLDVIQTWTADQTFSGDVDFLGDIDITSINGVPYTFPAVQGGVNTYLKNDGVGNLSWAAITLPANVAYLDVIQTWTAAQFFQANITGINNVSYVFPAVQGAASTVLENDGAGNLSWSTVASVLPPNVAYLDVIQTWTAAQFFQANITGINNVSYVFPAIQGGASSYLSNDGAGNLSWAAVPAAIPGGLDGAVQYNNGGAFGGDTANFFWDDTSKFLGIGTATPADVIDVILPLPTGTRLAVTNPFPAGYSGAVFTNDVVSNVALSVFSSMYAGPPKYGVPIAGSTVLESFSPGTHLYLGTVGPASEVVIGVTNNEVARFTTSGYLGLNTFGVSPNASLDIVGGGVGGGGTDGMIQLTSDAAQTGQSILVQTVALASRFSVAVNAATGTAQEALVGIGNALTPTSQLHIVGPQPSIVVGNGTAALTTITALGGKGGDTSGVTGQTGGVGATYSFTGGAGGDAPAGSTNGPGGGFTFQLGARGTGLGTTTGVLSGMFLVKGSATHAGTTGDWFNVQSSAGNLVMAAGRGAFRQVIVPDNLIVGSNNMASKTFEAHGSSWLGGAFESTSASGLFISSLGGTSTEGVEVQGRRKNTGTTLVRPISFQNSASAPVVIGNNTVVPMDLTNSLQIVGKTLPDADGEVVTITNSHSVGPSDLPTRETSLAIVAADYKNSADARSLTNVALTLSATRPGANPANAAQALVVKDGMTAIQFSSYTAAGGANNDINVGSSHVRISGPVAPFSISGVAGGSLASLAPLDGTMVLLRNTTVQPMTVSHQSVSSTAGNRFCISNGADLVIPGEGQAVFVYEGKNPPPGLTPTAAMAGAGSGNVDNGTHSYKVTFVRASGESGPSNSSNIVTVVDKTVNGRVALSAIPLGPPDTIARNIYRTVTGDVGNYKRLTVGNTIGDNTTTTYQDNVADINLQSDAPSTFADTCWADYVSKTAYAGLATLATSAISVIKDVDSLPIDGTTLARTSTTTVTNTAVETDLTSKVMGGAPSVGRVYHIFTGGDVKNDAADTTQYRVSFGGTTVCDTGAMSTAVGATAYVFDAYVTVRTAGGAATVQCDGTFHVNTAVGVGGTFSVHATTGAVNLSGTPTLKTTALFAGASAPTANDEINETSAAIQVLN